ncbi:hypothetical protein MNBD_GAMMA09-1472 [hydrothermal vent metagenome]|uniref:HEAT repeat domain-containing protein n=1 Tax=hydrothermal vent metagenome TaxID=652676 RepID=A0A3B0XIH5_9ZZZZ
MTYLNNRSVVKTGLAIILILVMALLYHEIFVAPDGVIVGYTGPMKKSESIYPVKKTGKIISPLAGNNEAEVSVQAVDGSDFYSDIENNVCQGRRQDPFNIHCNRVSVIGVDNAELKEIKALKNILYNDTYVKQRMEAIKKLGKYRNKVSYEALLNAPFDPHSEVRLEILKQLYNLLPQLVKEYGDGIRYAFELAMSDMHSPVALLAQKALEEFDHLNTDVSENNNLNNNAQINDDFPH